MISDELILYRNFKNKKLLDDLITLFDGEGSISLAYESAGYLVTMATEMGFSGNLWHKFLTYILATNENAFSTACEIRGHVWGTLNDIALHDMDIFYQMFYFNLLDIDRKYRIDCFGPLKTFKMEDEGKMFNKRIRDRISELSDGLALASSPTEIKSLTESFYKDYGVGLFGLHKAFKIHESLTENDFEIVPIKRVMHINLEDLIGYETQKKKLIENKHLQNSERIK